MLVVVGVRNGVEFNFRLIKVGGFCIVDEVVYYGKFIVIFESVIRYCGYDRNFDLCSKI